MKELEKGWAWLFHSEALTAALTICTEDWSISIASWKERSSQGPGPSLRICRQLMVSEEG